MTGNQVPPRSGSRHPRDFMILTPSQIEVAAGADFTSSVSVWPAGPRHTVNASAPAGSGLRVEVDGHRVTVTGRLGHTGERHTVTVTVCDGTETAHDTLTVVAPELPSRSGHFGVHPHPHRR